METQFNHETFEDSAKSIEYIVLTSDNSSALHFCYWEFNGKEAVFSNGLMSSELTRSYWLLKKNAHGIDQKSQIPMNLDAILGGYVVLMTMQQKKVDPSLVYDLKAQYLDTTPMSLKDNSQYKHLVPIGYIDFYHKGKRKFAVGDLGIAKPYQGKSLSKLLIAAGTELVNAKKLIIPLNLGNAQGHYAWLHLSPLKIICAGHPHIEGLDNIIYEATIPKNRIKKLINQENEKFILFKDIKGYCDINSHVNVVGYKPGINGGLYVE